MLAYEVMGWIVDKVWGLIVAVILLPIALLGLLLDCLRRKVDKIPRRTGFRQKTKIAPTLIKPGNKPRKRKLQIVLDLDLTLVFCTNQKPD